MKFKSEYIATLLSLGILFGCNSETKDQKNSAPETNTKQQGTHVSVTAEKLKRAGVECSEVKVERMKMTVVAPAEVMASPNSEALIGPLVPGRIKKIMVQPNSIVQSGQVLAMLESAEIGNLTAELIQRHSEYIVAEADYQRKKELAGDNIIPKKTLQEAERSFKTATAMLQAVESRAAAAGFSHSDIQRMKSRPDSAVTSVPIRATISGAVASSEATLGKYVEPQTTLFRIISLSKVLIVGNVFEPDFGKLKAGQPVEALSGAYSGEPFTGTLQSVGIAINEETHTLPIRAIIDNPGQKLKPGMHVELKISTETPGDVMIVPNNAIGIDGTEKFVFVQKSDTLFERRAVLVSEQTKEMAAITKGVSKGEKVASKGVFFLKSILKSSETED